MIWNLSTSFRFFLVESVKANKNYQKRSLILQYIFTQKTSLILQTSAHSTWWKICSRQKTKNVFLVGVSKKYLNCIISRRPTAFSEHLESKYIPVIFRLKNFVLEMKEGFVWWRAE